MQCEKPLLAENYHKNTFKALKVFEVRLLSQSNSSVTVFFLKQHVHIKTHLFHIYCSNMPSFKQRDRTLQISLLKCFIFLNEMLFELDSGLLAHCEMRT